MTLHQFRIFAAVAKHRNVTKAARELYITQSCVSQQMKLLDKEYGAELYRRAAGGIELTHAGRGFLAAIMPILDQVNRLKKPLHQITRTYEPDRLAVGGTHSPSTLFLPLALSRLKYFHPALEIDFRTNNGIEIERLLLTQNIEVAVTTRRPHSDRIAAELIRRERVLLVISKHHRLAYRRKITTQDIANTPVLVGSSPEPEENSGPIKQVKTFIEQKGIDLKMGMRFDSPAAMKEAVYRKLGIGIFYEDVIKKDIKRGEFRAIAVPGLRLEGESYLAYLRDMPVSKIAAEFINLVKRMRSRE